jgi:hypothetical protein
MDTTTQNPKEAAEKFGTALIAEVGGPAVMARICDVTPQAVQKWVAGIPKGRYWFLMLHAAPAFESVKASVIQPCYRPNSR